MYTFRRVAAIVVCTLAFAVPLSAQPALAAEPTRPWVGNPDGLPLGDNGTVPLEQGSGSTWTFGTKGGTNLSS